MKRDGWISFCVAFLLLAGFSGCSDKVEDIFIGSTQEYLQNRNKFNDMVKDIPYRMVTVGKLKSNIDLIDLKLAVETRKAFGSKVLVVVEGGECGAAALPRVWCDINNVSSFSFITDEKNASALLHLKNGQAAYMIGQIIGSDYGRIAIRIE
jgi:hypothetical protein